MSIRLFMFALLLGFESASAQEFCSLTVQVVDPKGKIVAGVPVTVEEKTGRIESASGDGGEVRFCDLGVLPVVIRVGSPYDCDHTVVQNVPLTWGLTRQVRVIFDRMACLTDSPPPPLLCAVLFRFSDDKGSWIPGVEFKPAIQRFPNLRSDAYGRAMVRMANGEELHVKTSKDGYLPVAIDLKCSSNLTDRERTVILQKIQ
jgi:hypothetical protein